MLTFPNAKINIGLHILRKREDNFHELQTIFYPVNWCDVLEIIPNSAKNPTSEILFNTSGITIEGNREENLCVKAYYLLKNDFPNKILPINMHLHKNIPTGAGLGGGSADASAVLEMLNRIFGLQLDKNALIHYASKLGSDCAFFIQNTPHIGEGRGEILTNAKDYVDVDFLKNKFFLLVKPNIHISTKDAFAQIIPNQNRPHLKELIKTPFAEWKYCLENDFENSLFPKFPILQHTKQALYNTGATYASLSGSGATLFGIFEDKIDKSIIQTTFNHGFEVFF